jgi:TetR/AcrR family transcriptional repressor of nem operon
LLSFLFCAFSSREREPVDLDDVADMLSCIVDGAIIMSKTLNDPSRLERQILIFRSCVKLMYAPAAD